MLENKPLRLETFLVLTNIAITIRFGIPCISA